MGPLTFLCGIAQMTILSPPLYLPVYIFSTLLDEFTSSLSLNEVACIPLGLIRKHEYVCGLYTQYVELSSTVYSNRQALPCRCGKQEILQPRLRCRSICCIPLTGFLAGVKNLLRLSVTITSAVDATEAQGNDAKTVHETGIDFTQSAKKKKSNPALLSQLILESPCLPWDFGIRLRLSWSSIGCYSIETPSYCDHC